MTDDDIDEVAHLDSLNASSWAILHFRQQLKTPHTFHYVARHSANQKFIGFICGQLVEGEAEIHKIAVAEKYQRQSNANALMQTILLHLYKEDADHCFLELRASNIPAKALYKTFKFKQIAIRKKYYSSPVEDAIIMKLPNIS